MNQEAALSRDAERYPGSDRCLAGQRFKALAAFSLVEVVLAIGVVAFGFIAIFALVPAGMGIFRESMDTSVSAQIVQRVVSDATETDFEQLIASKDNTVSGSYYALPVRYFDDQGTEVKVVNPATLTATERQGILYWVRVRGSLPGKANPTEHKADFPTSLPSRGSNRFNPRDTTFLTVQIASNPAGKALEIDSQSYLLDPVKAKTAGLRLQTYSVVLARNGYAKKP